MPTLTHNSEYIRLNYNKEQEVTAPLDFQGRILVKEPTQNLNPATKSYVDKTLKDGLDDLKTQTPPVEITEKIKWDFAQIGTYGSLSFAGVGCFTFLNAEGYPYQIVAYSFQHDAIITSITSAIISAHPAIVWLAPTDANNIATANFSVLNARQITNNPTQEDLDYLATFNGLIQVKLKNESYPYISNINDWLIVPKLFQLVQLKALDGTQTNTGILPAAGYSLNFSFWIDDLDSIINYNNVVAINFMMLASSGTSIYATRSLQVTQSFNDKFINYSGIINAMDNTGTAKPIATLAKSLVTINTTKDEAYNKFKIRNDITNLYLKPTNQIFGFIDWNALDSKYTFGAE